MTLDEQQIEIAKACGWTWEVCYNPRKQQNFLWSPKKDKRAVIWKDGQRGGDNLPDYFNDLNAIHAAIKTLTPCQGITLCIHLNSYGIYGEFDILTASAHDLCQAFLETLGLWKP